MPSVGRANSRESPSHHSLACLPPLECFLLCLESCGDQAVTSPWDSVLLVDEEGLRTWNVGHPYARPCGLLTPLSDTLSACRTLMHVLVQSLVAIGCCLATASERQVQGKVLDLSNLDVWRGGVRQTGSSPPLPACSASQPQSLPSP